MALLDDLKRSATVVGGTDGLAIVISRANLADFCKKEPALGNKILWKLLSTLGGRLRNTNMMVTKTP